MLPGFLAARTAAGWQIKYALDAGAKGVLVPMVRLCSTRSAPPPVFRNADSRDGWTCGRAQVSTREQAAAVVAAVRFRPEGVRGFGSPFTQQA